MQFQIKINGTDLSENVRLDECFIRGALNGEIGTARFTLLVDQAIGPRYDFAHYGSAKFSTAADIDNLDTVEILEAGSSPENLLFSGYATSVEYNRVSPNIDEWRFEYQDHVLLLDTVIVNETYANKTDQYIIQDAFGALPEVDTSNVSSTQTLASFEAKDLTLRRLLEELASITGALFYLTPGKYLYYDDSNFSAAPFGVSDDPDEVSTFAYQLESYKKDYAGVANKVTVLGALNPSGGAELSATAQDTGHQTQYGRIYSLTLVDRAITDSAVLALKAQVELAARTSPRETGCLVVWTDGLGLGQGLAITSEAFSISGTYTVQELEIEKETEDTAVYRIYFGERDPQLVELMRRFNTEAGKVGQAIPPDGTVGDDKFDRVTDPIRIANADIVDCDFTKLTNVSITNSDIVDCDWSKITNVSVSNSDIVDCDFSKITNVSISDSDIVDCSWSKITSVAITNSDITDVDFSKVTNVSVTGSQIANLTIQNANIANLTLTGGKLANGTITDTQIGSLSADKITAGTLAVSYIDSWQGATISIGTGMSFTGSGDLTMAGGGNISVTPGYVAGTSIRGGTGGIDIPSSLGPYKMGGTTVIDTSRNATFNSLSIDSQATIDALGNADVNSLDVGGTTVITSGLVLQNVTYGNVVPAGSNSLGLLATPWTYAYVDVVRVSSGGDIHHGSYTVLNSSRALVNITAITTTGDITGDNVYPNSTNTYDLGSSSLQYDEAHIQKLCTSNYATSGSPASAATHKIPVYDGSGSLLNYMYLYP